MQYEFGTGSSGKLVRAMFRLSANRVSSREVMTQSTSQAGGDFVSEELEFHEASDSWLLLASSFLSKQGMIARWNIRDGEIPRVLLNTVFSNVPVMACGDFSRDM